MKLQQWTLFVDMLGYRDINGSIDNDEDARSFIEFMRSNNGIFDHMNGAGVRATYRQTPGFDLYEHYDVTAAFISDSMIITFKPKEVPSLTNPDKALMHSANTLFIICMRLQVLIFNVFWQKGMFLRGGISNKYAMISGQFAVGEGLIEAYKAESEIAKHPRIILHPEVTSNEGLMEKIKDIAERMYRGRGILQIDPEDGLTYLDYLGQAAASVDVSIPMIAQLATGQPQRFMEAREQIGKYFRSHGEAVQAKLDECAAKVDATTEPKAKATAEKVLAKFVWLKQYHNRSAADNPELALYTIP